MSAVVEGPAPRWVRVVTVVAVSVVAAVAAVVSYVHMHELADRAGEQWRAVLIPLSVDGLLVASSMVLYVRRRAGLPAGVLPWAGVVLGIAASLAANLAVARPDPVSLIVSGWPPLALAVAFELLIMVNRDRPAAGSGVVLPSTPAPGSSRVQVDEVSDVEHLDRAQTGAGVGLLGTPSGRFPAPGSVGDRGALPDGSGDRAGLDPVRLDELLADGAGRRRIARVLDIPESRARALLASRRNGHGPAEVTP